MACPVTTDRLTVRELRRRAAVARQSLQTCRMCEVQCGVDRIHDHSGACGLDDRTFCFKRYLSLAEEPELLPAYMVYLGACNFRCKFCIQAPHCFDPALGELVEAPSFAAVLEEAVRQGARSIMLLGGEPSLHIHTILDVAAEAGMPLPLVLKSNMYMTPPMLDLLEGVITLYLADFKFGNDGCAQRLAGMERYVEVVTRNMMLARSQSDLMVRHLLMPGHVDCCFVPVARWVAEHMPEARFHLMTGYVPSWRSSQGGELARPLHAAEIAAARDCLDALGLLHRENVRVS